jgi:putative ABC transport system substrate-binding protein
MRRREFLGVLGGAAAAWPVAALAQQQGKRPTIGILGTADASIWGGWVTAFTQRLSELGWVEGQNITVERRWADGRSERFAGIAAEFVRLKTDVIVTMGDAVSAAKQAAPATPIVFALAGDPVRTGLIASLARPGGNATGLSNLQADLSGKRVELLREVVPHLRRLAVMGGVGQPRSAIEMAEAQAAARALGLEVVSVEIRRSEDIAPALEGLVGRADALFVVAGPVIASNQVRLQRLALGARLPTIYSNREYVAAGGLMSYGPNWQHLFRRAADYVDKILHGAKPADLPVEQPTKFDLIINLVTAKTLGLTVPPTVLARADEVIE